MNSIGCLRIWNEYAPEKLKPKLKESDSVYRVATYKKFLNKENINKFTAKAFKLRGATETRKREKSLSVSWTLLCNKDTAAPKLRNVYGHAIGNVGKIRSLTNQRNYEIDVIFKPTDDNIAHSEITGLPHEDDSIADSEYFATKLVDIFNRV